MPAAHYRGMRSRRLRRRIRPATCRYLEQIARSRTCDRGAGITRERVKGGLGTRNYLKDFLSLVVANRLFFGEASCRMNWQNVTAIWRANLAASQQMTPTPKVETSTCEWLSFIACWLKPRSGRQPGDMNGWDRSGLTDSILRTPRASRPKDPRDLAPHPLSAPPGVIFHSFRSEQMSGFSMPRPQVCRLRRACGVPSDADPTRQQALC
jgi:hypothetical protein